MKKIILLSLLSFNMFSQGGYQLPNEYKKPNEINRGLDLLNNIRIFNMLEPLKIDSKLNILAEMQAQKLANNTYSEIDSMGESYYFQGTNLNIPINYYNGILGLTLKEDWIEKEAYQQLKCKTCTSVGFGKSKNINQNYIFIVFDSIK
jgi:hypothetical protein|tara:strand:- start:1622 stop:2065 length:444 start_codon:yes stop_codon:yes gene_type:complete